MIVLRKPRKQCSRRRCVACSHLLSLCCAFVLVAHGVWFRRSVDDAGLAVDADAFHRKIPHATTILPLTSPLNELCVRTEHTFMMEGVAPPPFERMSCGSLNETQARFFASSAITEIACTFRKYTYEEAMCVGKNVALDVDAFESYIRLAPRNPPTDRNHYAPPTDGLRGVLTSTRACSERTLLSNRARFGGGGSEIFARGFEGANTSAHKNIVVARESNAIVYVIAGSYGAGNPWHELEQVMNLYEVMLAHALPRNHGRVVIFDSPVRTTSEDVVRFHVPVYGELLRRVFSNGRPVTTMAAYVDDQKRGRAQRSGTAAPSIDSLHRETVLFDRVAFVPHGGASVFSRSSGGNLGCRPSPKVLSFV